FDAAAEAELQWNGFADAELSLVCRNRYFQDDIRIDRRRRLRTGVHSGNNNEREESKETHYRNIRRTIKQQRLVRKLERRSIPKSSSHGLGIAAQIDHNVHQPRKRSVVQISKSRPGHFASIRRLPN